VWFDVIGRHCPYFAVNREVGFLEGNMSCGDFLEGSARSFGDFLVECVGDLFLSFLQVLMPIPKPTGFTGADPYKM
jgi:hypothetical protein